MILAQLKDKYRSSVVRCSDTGTVLIGDKTYGLKPSDDLARYKNEHPDISFKRIKHYGITEKDILNTLKSKNNYLSLLIEKFDLDETFSE